MNSIMIVINNIFSIMADKIKQNNWIRLIYFQKYICFYY